MKTAVVLPFAGREGAARAQTIASGSHLSREVVKLQLAKILDSEVFVRAGRMRRFLSFVVEETLAGRSNRLCEYTIGLEVFDRGESFEPGMDPIVRNDARRLRQKLFEYYQNLGSNSGNQIVIEIPRGSYVPVFRSLSAPQRSCSTKAEYRLVISLIRIADGAEIWSTRHDYHA